VREGNTARLARLWGTIVFSISGSLMGLGVFSEHPAVRVAGVAALVCVPMLLLEAWRRRRRQ
jgi:hypothetical protein